MKIDKFHYHEFLDRIHVINTMIDEVLIKHPIADEHPFFKRGLESIQAELLQMYNEAGKLDHKINDESVNGIPIIGGSIKCVHCNMTNPAEMCICRKCGKNPHQMEYGGWTICPRCYGPMPQGRTICNRCET